MFPQPQPLRARSKTLSPDDGDRYLFLGNLGAAKLDASPGPPSPWWSGKPVVLAAAADSAPATSTGPTDQRRLQQGALAATATLRSQRHCGSCSLLHRSMAPRLSQPWPLGEQPVRNTEAEGSSAVSLGPGDQCPSRPAPAGITWSPTCGGKTHRWKRWCGPTAPYSEGRS